MWHFPPGGNGDPHLAPFPDELARRCILPTTLPGDLVLDPFSGSGTVPRVAEQLGRRAIGIELYAGDRAELIYGNRIADENGRRERMTPRTMKNARRQDTRRGDRLIPKAAK